MQMFMNSYGLYDFVWCTTMHRAEIRGTRPTILAPPSGRNHYCFDLGWECKINGHWGTWALSYFGEMGT